MEKEALSPPFLVVEVVNDGCQQPRLQSYLAAFERAGEKFPPHFA
jgi:hypothetical protein